jgi:Fasciclin domain
MPMTEHQQQVLKSEPGQEQHQTAGAAGTDMPATEHQQQVLADGGQPGQQEQQTAARTTTAEPSDMPMTEHQQQVLKSEPGQEQQQTAPAGATSMPATKHQRQVLAEEELPGKQQQSYEQARVEGRPDILREASVVAAGVQADNGVIHVIDAVLVPQSVLETLESAEGQG